MEYKDLIEHLRVLHDTMLRNDDVEDSAQAENIINVDAKVCKEAADAIERLVSENQEWLNFVKSMEERVETYQKRAEKCYEQFLAEHNTSDAMRLNWAAAENKLVELEDKFALAIDDLRIYGSCEVCKHYNEELSDCNKECAYDSHWEWKGERETAAQEE